MNKKILLISIISLFIVIIYEKIDYNVHIMEINNIFINDISSNKHDYIGYIEIEALNIKREIVLGINKENLKNHVTLSEKSKNLESDNVILAGHSIKNIFGPLHGIKIGDQIVIYSLENKYQYVVISTEIVSKNDIEVIDNSHLILITCTYDDKRLIVKAKKI